MNLQHIGCRQACQLKGHSFESSLSQQFVLNKILVITYSYNSIFFVISYKMYIIMPKDIDWYKDNKNISANYASTVRE